MSLRFESMTTPGWMKITDLDDIQIHVSPSEALELLQWLNEHQDELVKAAQADGHGKGGASLSIVANGDDVPEADGYEQASGEGDYLDIL